MTVGTVALAGLGLIGGSLARDLAARGVRVLAYDRDPGTLRAALAEGVAHAALGPALEGAEAAEVVVFALPVTAAPDALRAALPHLRRARLVTDAGSTKRSVGAAAEALGIGARFVGSHPLAGSHEHGWGAARGGLFRGARVFLSPAARSTEEALRLARELWLGVGAEPEVVDPAEHDRLLAWTSHLPQAASTALALALAAEGVPPGELGPGGRGATRLAGSSPEMWAAIARDNADHLLPALDSLRGRLDELRAALARGDEPALHAFFAAGRAWSGAP